MTLKDVKKGETVWILYDYNEPARATVLRKIADDDGSGLAEVELHLGLFSSRKQWFLLSEPVYKEVD